MMRTAVIVGEMRSIDWVSSLGNPSASGHSSDDVAKMVGDGCVPRLFTGIPVAISWGEGWW
jgi:hypothetical protein